MYVKINQEEGTYSMVMSIKWANFIKFSARYVTIPKFKRSRSFANCQEHFM